MLVAGVVLVGGATPGAGCGVVRLAAGAAGPLHAASDAIMLAAARVRT